MLQSVLLDLMTRLTEATTFPLKILTESFDDGRTLEVTLTEHKRVVRYYADSNNGIAVVLVSFHVLWVLYAHNTCYIYTPEVRQY